MVNTMQSAGGQVVYHFSLGTNSYDYFGKRDFHDKTSDGQAAGDYAIQLAIDCATCVLHATAGGARNALPHCTSGRTGGMYCT